MPSTHTKCVYGFSGHGVKRPGRFSIGLAALLGGFIDLAVDTGDAKVLTREGAVACVGDQQRHANQGQPRYSRLR